MLTKIILGIVIIILIAGGVWYFNFYQKEEPELIGGQTDEHGCLIAAGYSWCEDSQKCLRAWEEYCADEAPAAQARVKEILANKYDKEISQVVLNIRNQDQSHIVGGVKFSTDPQAEGGMFLAAKVNGEWQLLYDGNGSVDCEGLKDYDFPAGMLQGFCD